MALTMTHVTMVTIGLFAAILLGACSKGADSDEAQMKAGLDALYARQDPNAAAVHFRKVLARTPTHYGATFQLATALDRAAKRDEARPYWEKMLAIAETSRDDKTAAIARARLGKPEPTSEAAIQAEMMKVGLNALYRRADPAAAAGEFRKLLKRNPNHYGATFQLAMALDRGGKPAEARPVWQKVLNMAERSKDQETAAAARARLARRP
jgi:tetratricopeptide (TPR) repeat protein